MIGQPPAGARLQIEAYLLKLTDAIRQLDDPVEIQVVAQRVLALELDADRVAYAEDLGDGVHVQLTRDWTNRGPSLAGRYRYADYGIELMTALLAGRSSIRPDIQADPSLSPAEKAAHATLGLGATLNVPLVKNGGLVAILAVHFAGPHDFTETEVAVTEATAERTWAAVERARAEAALRQNEEKYRELFSSMDQGYCIIQMLYDGKKAVDWRYIEVNAAFERHNGLHDATGKTIKELTPDIEEKWIEIYDRVAVTGESLRFEENSSALEDRTFDLYAFRVGRPETRQVAVLFQDISEQKRAQAALRASEERFRKFADASSDALWIRDAKTLAVEFASQAMETVLGISPDAARADARALDAMILPEDRPDVMANVAAIRRGEAVVHDYRILRPSDGAFRWIRSTGFPLLDNLGQVERIAGFSTDITDARISTEHQAVLLAELQHRVRNIMAVIRSIASRSASTADSVASYQSLLAGRLTALARVQALLTRSTETGTILGTMIEEEVSAHAPQPGQVTLDGPPIELGPKAIEVLTLAIHELTTNAAKYGALAVPHGKLTIRWTQQVRRGTDWLHIDWQESGLTDLSEPRRRGFGSELIERRIPYELDGTGEMQFSPTGLRCTLEFPLPEKASILDTASPTPVSVHGGSLDLAQAPNLSGYRILVSEDDYLLASDVSTALRRAGATVIGPFADEMRAKESAETEHPDAAILDINLGTGAGFGLAAYLGERATPFLFLTGYDTEIIPPGLAGITQIQKPASLLKVVQAVHRLLRPTET
ncbi:hypothetical protein ASG47_12590 [Devosia sp. Leaf420]|uniref:HWE histidine kinase domain-containing protein n=1 Tax=Devosia sp. Leaf420 TaxID=1736374 RepID=UPI000712C77E|nr:HWE histidine kinase domain-containing protein [Devosia sp. Leaf420]KQT45781.1 hypothetical protein ASG47_12590 [Devosia sp. Leaf420]